MKTMQMPGFTAEASLFTMVEYYRQTMALRPTNLDSIQPAASCYHDCIQDCFSDRGHPHPGVCIRLCRSICRTSL